MNTPIDPHAWRRLQDRAAAQLRPDFADRVLAAAQTPSRTLAWSRNPVFVSFATVAVCFALLFLVHSRMTEAASARHLADWEAISSQTASLEPHP